MKFDYPHSFDLSEAKERMSALGDYLQNKYGLNVTWQDNKATFTGKFKIVTIDGTLEVSGNKVDFSGKDPGMLLRKKATSYLKDKLATYLDPSKPVDSLRRS